MKILKLAALGIFTVVMNGCLDLSIGVGNRSSRPAEVVVVPGPRDGGTLAEIDAAAQLSFDHQKAGALEPIARRPGLSPVAQVHFVKTVYGRLSFDQDKVRLLEALIQNPAFSEHAKQVILVDLHRLAFDQGKQAILAAINQQALRNPPPGPPGQPGLPALPQPPQRPMLPNEPIQRPVRVPREN